MRNCDLRFTKGQWESPNKYCGLTPLYSSGEDVLRDFPGTPPGTLFTVFGSENELNEPTIARVVPILKMKRWRSFDCEPFSKRKAHLPPN